MLITRFLPHIDYKLANAAASIALLALLQFHLPSAQAGEQATPLPPGTITVEDTRYAPAPPGTTVPQVPVASPRPSAEEMVDAAKRNIGQIDRDLRKDTSAAAEPLPAPAATPNRQEILEKALAGPVVPKDAPRPGETTMEDITRPDGQRVTKVTGPNGTYCVTQISVGNTKGEDIIQRGAISRTTSCGSGF
ncbi:hypothetical protein [Collimonas sp.]|jgi:hypothetical protein|uniref:hypothetical protein n=1 Tax=Collimonas sp. TaxID=1963772 RepID=UPI0037C0A0BF